MMALLAFPGGMPAAVAQTADPVASDPRFTLQPANGGMLKLDTRTGALSFCSMKSGAWVCEAVPEDRAALEAEIARLNARIAELEKGRAGGVPDIMGAPVPPQAAPPAASPPAAAPPAADGEESGTQEAQKRLDQAMDMAEHAFRRFFDMVERLRGREPAPQEQSL
ncbi:hypothetical protein FHS55_003705 [Angulomicrobium tetraedrale]|uniref:Uncharacterized protein n=1 Tax=Ancylobacter tetraedralis TaxID=217068 RepID=A0A839ZE95_9HYPH|nr:hypothetical protein [Ancylobacter tetraedralis]MBB3773074.1 hypothetical protein [Ancylobacter tetraedralis]